MYEEMSGLGTLLGLWVGVMVILAILCVFIYVLFCIAIRKFLVFMNYENTWMAFIPIVQNWAMVDAVPMQSYPIIGNLAFPKLVVVFWVFISPFLGIVPILGSILSIVSNILVYGSFYKHAYACINGNSPEDNNVLGYVSAFIGIIVIVKFLLIPKDKHYNGNLGFAQGGMNTYNPYGGMTGMWNQQQYGNNYGQSQGGMTGMWNQQQYGNSYNQQSFTQPNQPRNDGNQYNDDNLF